MVCAISHDLESDYPWSGHKDKNSPTPDLIIISTRNVKVNKNGESLIKDRFEFIDFPVICNQLRILIS